MPDPFEVMTDQPWEVQQSPPSSDVANPFETLSSSTAQRRRDSFTSAAASTRSRSLSASTDNNLERRLSPDSIQETPSTPWRRKSSFVQRDQLVRQASNTSPPQQQQVRPISVQPRRNSRNRHSLMMTTTQPVTPGMIYETPSSSSSSLPLHPPQPAFLGRSRPVSQLSSEDLWSMGADGNPNDETPLQTARRQSRLVDKRRDSYHQGLPTEVIWPISMPDEDFLPQKQKSTASIQSLSRRSSKISLSKKLSRKSSGGALNNGLTMSPTAKTDHSRAASIALSSAHSSTTSLHMQQSVRGSKPPSTYSRDFLSSLAPREGGYAIAAQIGSPQSASLSEGKRKSYHEGRAPVAKSGGMRWSLDGGEQYGRSPYASRAGSEQSINTSSNLSTQPPIIPNDAAPAPAPMETLVTPTTPIEPTLPAGASPPSVSMQSTSSFPSEAAPSPQAPPAPAPLSKKEQKAKAKADAERAAREKAEAARQAARAKAEFAQNEAKRKEQEKKDKAEAKRKAKLDKQKAKDEAKRAPARAPAVAAASVSASAQAPASAKPPMHKKPSFFGSIRKRFMSSEAPPMPVPAVAVRDVEVPPTPSAGLLPSAVPPPAPAQDEPSHEQTVPTPALAPAFDYPSPPRSPQMQSSLAREPSHDASAAPAPDPSPQPPATPMSLARSLSKEMPATPPSLARTLSKDMPATPHNIPLPVSRSTTRTSPSPSRQLPSPPTDIARSQSRRVSGPRANPLASSPSIRRDYHDSSSATSDSIVTPFSSAPSSHDPESDSCHDLKEQHDSAETISLPRPVA